MDRDQEEDDEDGDETPDHESEDELALDGGSSSDEAEESDDVKVSCDLSYKNTTTHLRS